MLEKKKGTFLDGETSQPYNVFFSYDSNQVVIEKENGEIISLNWQDVNNKDSIFSKNELRLNFFEFPQKVLWIHQSEIIEEMLEFFDRINIQLKFGKSYSLKKILLLTVAFIFLVVLFFMALPFVSGLIARQIPLSVEKQLGRKILVNMLEENDTLMVHKEWKATNSVFLDYLKTDDLDIEIYLVDTPVANAFALPGGQIVIFSGLLKKLPNAESYLALLGHEVGHITNRHILKQLIENSVIAVVFGMSFGDISGVSTVLLNVAGELTSLSYSRDMENEADRYAVMQLEANQISLEGLVDLFAVFSKKENFISGELEFLSSHPISKKRLVKAKRMLESQSCNCTVPKELKIEWDRIQSAIGKLESQSK